MLDCLGNKISTGDKIIVCHSGGTNSTLLLGQVLDVSDKRVKYAVLTTGKKCSYGSHPEIGEVRTTFMSHRVYVIRGV